MKVRVGLLIIWIVAVPAPSAAEQVCDDITYPASRTGVLERLEPDGWEIMQPYAIIDDSGRRWTLYTDGPFFGPGINLTSDEELANADPKLLRYVGSRVAVEGCYGGEGDGATYVTRIRGVYPS